MADEARFSAIESKVDELEKAIQEDRLAARERENSRLRWGIGVLGAVVMGLSAYIWQQVGHLFDLGGPR